MKAIAYCERPSKTGFGMFWIIVVMLIAGYASNGYGAQDASVEDSQPARTNYVYAKIVLPMKVPSAGNHPVV